MAPPFDVVTGRSPGRSDKIIFLDFDDLLHPPLALPIRHPKSYYHTYSEEECGHDESKSQIVALRPICRVEI